eukprot:1159331-Pelagomonas_calceolata.AAC.8
MLRAIVTTRMDVALFPPKTNFTKNAPNHSAGSQPSDFSHCASAAGRIKCMGFCPSLPVHGLWAAGPSYFQPCALALRACSPVSHQACDVICVPQNISVSHRARKPAHRSAVKHVMPSACPKNLSR